MAATITCGSSFLEATLGSALKSFANNPEAGGDDGCAAEYLSQSERAALRNPLE